MRELYAFGAAVGLVTVGVGCDAAVPVTVAGVFCGVGDAEGMAVAGDDGAVEKAEHEASSSQQQNIVEVKRTKRYNMHYPS
jgi:hypothetical protein